MKEISVFQASQTRKKGPRLVEGAETIYMITYSPTVIDGFRSWINNVKYEIMFRIIFGRKEDLIAVSP